MANNFAEAITRAAHLGVHTATRRRGVDVTYYPHGKPKKTITAVVQLDGDMERDIGPTERNTVQMATILVAASDIENHRMDEYDILGDGHKWQVDAERVRVRSHVVNQSAAGEHLRGLATVPLWRRDPIEMTSEGIRRRHS